MVSRVGEMYIWEDGLYIWEDGGESQGSMVHGGLSCYSRSTDLPLGIFDYILKKIYLHGTFQNMNVLRSMRDDRSTPRVPCMVQLLVCAVDSGCVGGDVLLRMPIVM